MSATCGGVSFATSTAPPPKPQVESSQWMDSLCASDLGSIAEINGSLRAGPWKQSMGWSNDNLRYDDENFPPLLMIIIREISHIMLLNPYGKANKIWAILLKIGKL